MPAFPYPVDTLTDDAGAILAGATVTIASVKTPAGVDIGSHGATVLGVDGSNVLATADAWVSYDAEAKGEATIVLAVSKSARTVTGLNASPRVFATRDAQRLNLGFDATGKATVGSYGTGQDPATLLAAAGYNGTRAANLDRLDAAVTTRMGSSAQPTVGGYAAGMDPASLLATPIGKVASILAAIEANQDGGTVTVGGSTSITVAGLAIPLANLNGLSLACSVFDQANAFKGRLPIATATASGGNVVLNFAGSGFPSPVLTTDTVVIS